MVSGLDKRLIDDGCIIISVITVSGIEDVHYHGHGDVGGDVEDRRMKKPTSQTNSYLLYV